MSTDFRREIGNIGANLDRRMASKCGSVAAENH